MIDRVTKRQLTYTCDFPLSGVAACNTENMVKLSAIGPADEYNTVKLPPCKACGSIRVVSLDPVENVDGRPHPGLDLEGRQHTPAAIDKIHGQALGVALAGLDPKQVYNTYLAKV